MLGLRELLVMATLVSGGTGAPTCPWCPDIPTICPGWPDPTSPSLATNYSNADLPDLRTLLNGSTVVATGPLWDARKAEIGRLLQEYIYGFMPEEIPKLTATKVLNTTASGRGGISTFVRLTFVANGTDVSFVVEVVRPTGSTGTRPANTATTTVAGTEGTARRPLFVTQTNHRRWALKGVARGYVGLLVPSCDVNDQTSGFAAAYPGASWALIIRRAWVASRALDYALQLDDVNSRSVSISGHSRNGKQALLAAAFDPRITAVVSSSSGSPGMAPYRTTSANTFNEGPGDAPIEWWARSVNCFKGFEDRLPIDSHGLLALIAPRHLMAATAWTDGCEPVWAVERAYKAGRKVYQMMGSADHLRIKYRPGSHHGYLDVDSYFDWFDVARGRSGFDAAGLFPEALLFDFDWHSWRRAVPGSVAAPPAGSTRREKIAWGLGTAPAAVSSPGGYYGEQCEEGPNSAGCYMALMLGHTDRFQGVNSTANVTRSDVSFGEYISGSVYHLADATGPLPVVVFMHPLSYNIGFNENYIESVTQTAIYFALAEAGFAVLAYDAVGFGSRLTEVSGVSGGGQGVDGLPLFYRRYPEWSLLGKIVHDGLAAVDLLATTGGRFYPGHDKPEGLPKFDTDNIFLLGYDIGGRAALYTAAMEDRTRPRPSRIKGVISINGWTPMRTDTNASATGGIARLWDWHALQPVLGFYDGREHSLPYDMDDVLVEANVPTLVYQQLYDRTADPAAVTEAVGRALAQGADVTLMSTKSVNRLDDEVHAAAIGWLKDRL